MPSKRPLGNHEYVELTLDLINGGDLIRQVNDALNAAYRQTEHWEHASPDGGFRPGKFEVSVTILAERTGNDHMSLSAKIKSRTPPTIVKGGLVRAVAGRLLCDEDGSSDPNDSQMRMFNGRGEVIRTIDTDTGEEVLTDRAIAGKVAAAGG